MLAFGASAEWHHTDRSITECAVCLHAHACLVNQGSTVLACSRTSQLEVYGAERLSVWAL